MTNAKKDIQKLLKEQAVSEILNISLPTLRRFRTLGEGPPYKKIGASVRYDPEELSCYLRDSTCVPLADPE
jgi:hypothetical protein